ncbi:uncharacterized protein C8A04DRAFT_27194 [Dichotomopilus funicola]|uniref:SRR1-like domain-containing protein n=1 Tax=Dichotomopilus funicola TaxID=1934379 RepID=A0AAN6V536_9PEZI|nr:hypothetical protein C8A04DRAFT_27194 [Dichotomopilus funicola]
MTRKTAHIQTAVFCYLVEYFKAQTGEEIQSIIQEPMFTETDKAFCATLSLEAVDSPRAFSVIDEETMVFAIHMELSTYSQALSAHVPALLVGSDPENWETAARVEPEIQADLEGYGRIGQTHGKVVFPDLEMMFFSTVLYWRRGES